MNGTKSVSGGGDIAAEPSIGPNISRVANRIWTGGDLPSHRGDAAMLADLAAIQEAGITHILDNRIDWRRGTIPMSVDVAHLDAAGRPLVVFDAKYKVASATGQYANADHYQMLGYCTSLGVSKAWLIYAGGSRTARVRKIKNTSVEVVECPLDLSQHPRQILQQIERIARLAVHHDPKVGHPVVKAS